MGRSLRSLGAATLRLHLSQPHSLSLSLFQLKSERGNQVDPNQSRKKQTHPVDHAMDTLEQSVQQSKKVKKVKKVTIKKSQSDADGTNTTTTTIEEFSNVTKEPEEPQGGEYTKAMSKDWHLGHFSCWQCDESLTGQRYVLRDEHPYCVKCYETLFANSCDDCNRTIGIDSKDLSYKDRHWHEACFLCNKCRLSLVDKQFGSKAEKIFCGPCYDSMYATRCDGCQEI